MNNTTNAAGTDQAWRKQIESVMGEVTPDRVKRTNDLRLWLLDHEVDVTQTGASGEIVVFGDSSVKQLAAFSLETRIEFYVLLKAALVVREGSPETDFLERIQARVAGQVEGHAEQERVEAWWSSESDKERLLPPAHLVYGSADWVRHMASLRALVVEPSVADLFAFVKVAPNVVARRQRMVAFPKDRFDAFLEANLPAFKGVERPTSIDEQVVWLAANWREVPQEVAFDILGSCEQYHRIFLVKQDGDVQAFFFDLLRKEMLHRDEMSA